MPLLVSEKERGRGGREEDMTVLDVVAHHFFPPLSKGGIEEGEKKKDRKAKKVMVGKSKCSFFP